MSLSPSDIKSIVEALHRSEWDTATIVVGDVSISVSRHGAAAPLAVGPASEASAARPAPNPASEPSSRPDASEAAQAVPQATVDTPGAGTLVAAPSVGVFWSAPEPGAQPFVQVGQRVEKGDTLCIVEIMKLMNSVTAEFSGTVLEIHAENAQAVEFGTPLFTIAEED
ncbi:acetyl-CoA carboxylase biotin carboxyl carrier protein [Leucobacter weissii]|uniref:Biotin carboxyl carrier protein of acetyl-CoA carboxylase n=1 Tax=Leucobacter weissii TaxID=1983706 RepID=A0A939MIP1_9MICO|nr:acetyl-CoA carboxylase biotin carboxyl carrier protein [Leucobacter weissii]MBO1901448.1 acetyl-CoA carboxylase biotin carboxyl carrier protein [Leucobacter weissii]